MNDAFKEKLWSPFKEVPEGTLAMSREVEYGKRQENSPEKRLSR